jgi:hypothetical protein
MSSFPEYGSLVSFLIKVDHMVGSPVRPDVGIARSFGLSIRNLGILVIACKLARFVKHVEVHLVSQL